LKALAQDLYVASEICAVTDRDDEPAPAPGQVLNKNRTLRTTRFNTPDTEDSNFQDCRFYVGFRPHGVGKFVPSSRRPGEIERTPL
jgi:hypothetical protein